MSHSEETKRKIGLGNKGKKHPNRKKPSPFSEEHRKKISDATKGTNNPMYGKKFKHTLEARLKIADAGKERIFSQKTKQKIKNALLGNKNALGAVRSDEQKRKLSLSKMGAKNPMFGEGGSKEKHWNWENGITPLNHLIRRCFKYRQWRSDIFTKDNFTCQECWTKNGSGKTIYLEAHHIKEFSKIIEEYQIKTLEQALNCEELWNINNGRTLCIFCHNKTKGRAKNKIK